MNVAKILSHLSWMMLTQSPGSVVEPTQSITCQEKRRLSETDASNPRQVKKPQVSCPMDKSTSREQKNQIDEQIARYIFATSTPFKSVEH